MSKLTDPSTDLEPTDDYPIADPGLEEHEESWYASDEATGKRVYREVVTMFALSPLFAIAAIVCFFAIPRDLVIDFGPLFTPAKHFFFGGCIAVSVLLIGFGAIHWARTMMNDEEIIEERHPARSDDAAREEALANFEKGVSDSGIGRRKLLGRSLMGALGLFAIPVLMPLADLGPWPTKSVRKRTIERTLFAETTADKPVRLVNDVTWAPIHARDLEIGQLVNAQPENLQDTHGAEFQAERAKSSIIVVRMDPASIKIPESRKDWHVNGILCYSKICTHVGCAITLWEQQTHHLLCPCHQSTFDLGNSGVVVFGPAARALPQLPITLDEEGVLVARSDFTVPVGPSYFERDSRNDYKDGDL